MAPRVAVGLALILTWTLVSLCAFSLVRAGEGGGSEPVPVYRWYFPVITEGDNIGYEEND